ncbi:MAG TPA: site-2 protease family protein [Alphaproteobacteria bacterium]
MDLFSSVWGILATAIPVVIAITSHEAAHGYVAWRLGDDTAYRLGRVTFNPFRHIDAFGTVLLPALLVLMRAPFLFGWAKPVPVDFSRLRRPRRDMVLVAAAGPGVNMLLAFISGILLTLTLALFGDESGRLGALGAWIAVGLSISALINVVLAVFNMLPLPPLDGGRVAVGLLPDRLAFPLARLERWGLLIVIGVLFVIPALAAELHYDISPYRWVIRPVVVFALRVVETLTGAPIIRILTEIESGI